MLVCVLVPIRLAHVSSNFPNCRLKLDVLVSDADAVELLELSVELVDYKSSNSCEKELCALVRSPDERASKSVEKLLDKVLELLVDVTESVLTDSLAGGGGGGPCMCCMIFAKIL